MQVGKETHMLYSFQQGLLNAPAKRDPDRRLLLLPVEEIRVIPERSRKDTDRASLAELMVSIAQVGLVEPVVVRERREDGYELIAGERRLAACRLLGRKEIPALVVQAGDERCALIALAENLHRKDLHYLDEAERLRTILDRGTLTAEQLSTRLGRKDPYLANRLRLLTLSQNVRARLRSARLSERYARALLRLGDEERRQQALDVIERRRMSAPSAERLVDSMTDSSGAAPMRILRFSRDCRLFINSVKTCIEQLDGSGITAAMEENRREDGVDLIIRVRT